MINTEKLNTPFWKGIKFILAGHGILTFLTLVSTIWLYLVGQGLDGPLLGPSSFLQSFIGMFLFTIVFICFGLPLAQLVYAIPAMIYWAVKRETDTFLGGLTVTGLTFILWLFGFGLCTVLIIIAPKVLG